MSRIAEGWRAIPDLPLEIARNCDPSQNAHLTYMRYGRAIEYDVDGEWYRVYVDRQNNVYYQQWSTIDYD